jgi:beta-glucosidase-like glycosyl hydrolase
VQEVPSEDANLVAQYSQAFISGLQGLQQQRHLLVASTAKHYIGYDMEGYIPRAAIQIKLNSKEV